MGDRQEGTRFAPRFAPDRSSSLAVCMQESSPLRKPYSQLKQSSSKDDMSRLRRTADPCEDLSALGALGVRSLTSRPGPGS